jgi:hypothetical protein
MPILLPQAEMIECLQNERFIKVSRNITISVPEIKFVSKNKGDATTLILLNIQKLTTIYFCYSKYIIEMTGRS